MTITLTAIISAVKRHLSVIGKRLYNKDGKNMFSDITVSQAEEALLLQYVTSSAQDVEAVLKPLVTATSYTATTITINLRNTRGDADFDTRAKALTESYLTQNVVGEYLDMVHPELAQKYRRDASQRMEALVAYVFYKKPPTT